MGYRWKPSAAQKKEYAESMRKRESLPVRTTPFAIRVGCFLKWYSVGKGMILEGEVTNSSYGEKTNQHTFTIETNQGKVLVKGRNLYSNIIEHKQGEESQSL